MFSKSPHKIQNLRVKIRHNPIMPIFFLEGNHAIAMVALHFFLKRQELILLECNLFDVYFVI